MFKLSLTWSWLSLLVVAGLACASRSLTPADAQRPIDAPTSPIDAPAGPLDAARDTAVRRDAALETRSDGAIDATPRDATSRDATSYDASACGCTIDSGNVLHMSWDCFCHYYGCPTAPRSAGCSSSLRYASACGLLAATWRDAAAPLWTYYDSTGAAVGVRWFSDETSGEFGCTGYGGGAGALEAGRVPSSTCTMDDCTCDVGELALLCPGDAGLSH